MTIANQFKGIFILTLSLFLFSCGSGDKNESSSNNTAKKSTNILPSKCDKIIKEYDVLVTKAIKIARDKMDGKEVDSAEEEQLAKDGAELAKKIQNLGLVGLGGQHCYQEFIDIQMKWTELATELQQDAIKKAMEQVNNK